MSNVLSEKDFHVGWHSLPNGFTKHDTGYSIQPVGDPRLPCIYILFKTLGDLHMYENDFGTVFGAKDAAYKHYKANFEKEAVLPDFDALDRRIEEETEDVFDEDAMQKSYLSAMRGNANPVILNFIINSLPLPQYNTDFMRSIFNAACAAGYTLSYFPPHDLHCVIKLVDGVGFFAHQEQRSFGSNSEYVIDLSNGSTVYVDEVLTSSGKFNDDNNFYPYLIDGDTFGGLGDDTDTVFDMPPGECIEVY